MRADHISTWAASYGIEGITVDGNDVDAVLAAARKAVATIRETRKPVLLETYTYRQRGHYEPDDQSYVNAAELAAWRAKDPIDTFKNKLVKNGVLTTKDIDAIQQRVNATIEQATAFAQSSPMPEFNELTTDVYA